MLKPINNWTKARIIKQIETNMLGHKSCNYKDECVYRALDSNKCAVGVFIPDSLYHTSFEESSIQALWPKLSDVMPLNLAGMQRLQRIHDSCGLLRDPRLLLVEWITANVEG